MSDYMPTTKSYFKVEIDKVSYTNFTSVSGLEASAEVSDDMGGQDKNARKVVGKVKYNTITLVRNADVRDKLLRDWWKTVEDGNPEVRSVSIVFMSRDGTKELARRDLYNAVPSRWAISDLSSTENGLNTETIAIDYESAAWK
jgi:phage tail-like protein